MAFNMASMPVAVLTDSYKVSHFEQYPPDCKRMAAYGEFRTPMDKDYSERRVLWYGIRYIVETYLHRKWTMEDVKQAELFYSTHCAGKTPYPFPKDLFTKFVEENDGYFPVKLEALPEGFAAHVHTPVYQITASGDYAKLVTFLETILTMVWYPSTVATLSRYVKDSIEAAFEKSVDDDQKFLLMSRLHDFGFRGCTSVEQSAIGGSAHLINFDGTDTLSAAYYVQFGLNGGKPVGESIPATEHSVMTSWKTERGAIENMIDKFGAGLYATVMDSYDYANCLDKVVGSVKDKKLAKKTGFWVFRPDSGDPVEAILMALRAGEKHFGATENKKGFKVLNGIGALQGDGIGRKEVKAILDAVMKEGYAASNVAFGMGGGLLQKVNRDTMGFATKLSFIEYGDGTCRDVMKAPKTDPNKVSLPGILRVKLDKATGQETVIPRDPEDTDSYDDDDILRPVYNMRPLEDSPWADFQAIRERAGNEWSKAKPDHDPVGPAMKEKIAAWIAAQTALFKEEYGAEFKAADRDAAAAGKAEA